MLYYMSNKPDEEWWVENIAWWAEYIACSDYATPSVVYWEELAIPEISAAEGRLGPRWR